MLVQILSKTPLYVWAILAFLVFRGVLAARDREMSLAKMLVIPVLLFALSLQAVAGKFGVQTLAMAAWALASGAVMLQRWRFGKARVSPGAAPGSLHVRGSWAPLAMMLLVFLTKYVSTVMLAVRPQLAHSLPFAVTTCGLLGLCSGYFVGQLLRDLAAYRRTRGSVQAAQPCSAVGAHPV